MKTRSSGLKQPIQSWTVSSPQAHCERPASRREVRPCAPMAQSNIAFVLKPGVVPATVKHKARLLACDDLTQDLDAKVMRFVFPWGFAR